MTPRHAGHRWGMLALLFAARVGLGFNFQTLGSVADPLVRDLHLSFTEIGTLIGLFNAPGLVLSIPAGLAGRRVSDRVLVAGGLVAMVAAGALAAVADGFALLALARLLPRARFVGSTPFLTPKGS